MTTGLHEEELIILAARPAVGKTAFALNIAQNIGTKQDRTVAIFSLEMGAESLVSRMIAAEGSIDSHSLRTGQLNDQEWNDYFMATGTLSRASIYIDDTPGIKISEIRARSRKLAQETGNLGLIVIDYLQLISGTGRENRQQEVSEISRQLKILAKELKVPVIALSQLSRGVEQRQDKRPVLSDIRESGSIEQDADIVAFLYRDDYYERGTGEDEDGEEILEDNKVEVIIEKNRSGSRGTVELLFIKEHNKFASIDNRYGDQIFLTNSCQSRILLQEKMLTAPIQVRLFDLPMDFWDPEILEGIGNSIGTFVKVADTTRKGRYTFYAQICVYMNITEPLPDCIEVEYHDEIQQQPLDYEHITFRCQRCHEYGHLFRSCPQKFSEPTQGSWKEEGSGKETEGGFQEVHRRKRTQKPMNNHKKPTKRGGTSRPEQIRSATRRGMGREQ